MGLDPEGPAERVFLKLEVAACVLVFLTVALAHIFEMFDHLHLKNADEQHAGPDSSQSKPRPISFSVRIDDYGRPEYPSSEGPRLKVIASLLITVAGSALIYLGILSADPRSFIWAFCTYCRAL